MPAGILLRVLLVVLFSGCNPPQREKLPAQADKIGAAAIAEFLSRPIAGELQPARNLAFDETGVPDTTGNDVIVLSGSRGEIVEIDGQYAIETPAGKKYWIDVSKGERLEARDGYVRVVRDPRTASQLEDEARALVERMKDGS